MERARGPHPRADIGCEALTEERAHLVAELARRCREVSLHGCDRGRESLVGDHGPVASLVADPRAPGPGAPQAELRVVLQREAVPAVHLDRVGRHVTGDRRAPAVCRTCIGCRAPARIQGCADREREEARRVHGGGVVGETVLQSLERADAPTELLPLLAVVDRELERAGCEADETCRLEDPELVEAPRHVAGEGRAHTQLASISCRLARREANADDLVRLVEQPAVVARDEDQIGHRHERRRRRRIGDDGDRAPVGDPRGTLVVQVGEHAGSHHRLRQRYGCERATRRLGDELRVHERGCTSPRLRRAHRGQADRRHRSPQLTVEAVGLLDRAHACGRGSIAEESLETVAERGLLVGELDVHEHGQVRFVPFGNTMSHPIAATIAPPPW